MRRQFKYESAIHIAVRKMVNQRMTIRPFVTHEGKMIYNVDGFNLTTEQILELDSKRELTSWGIAEFARTAAHK